MKKAAIPAIALVLALGACGPSEQPAGSAEGETVVQGDEWTPDEAKPGDVEVNLPETDMKVTPPEGTVPAPAAGNAQTTSKTPASPEAPSTTR